MDIKPDLKRIFFCAVVVAFSSLLSTSLHSQTEVDPLEVRLVEAMQLNARTGERIRESGDAIRAYIKAGYVRAKPDSRVDYVDSRVLRRPAKFFGHNLLVIEEEYPSKYIGCCVSPGIGVILQPVGDLKPLREFAASNGCSVGNEFLPSELKMLGIKTKKEDEYVVVSCRERDKQR